MQDVYGIKIDTKNDCLNLGKIIHEDIGFHDSENSTGIQIADLLASGIRRCLRNQFQNNSKVAELLGSLFVAPKKGDIAINLIELRDIENGNNSQISVKNSAYDFVKIISSNNRQMIHKHKA